MHSIELGELYNLQCKIFQLHGYNAKHKMCSIMKTSLLVCFISITFDMGVSHG